MCTHIISVNDFKCKELQGMRGICNIYTTLFGQIHGCVALPRNIEFMDLSHCWSNASSLGKWWSGEEVAFCMKFSAKEMVKPLAPCGFRFFKPFDLLIYHACYELSHGKYDTWSVFFASLSGESFWHINKVTNLFSGFCTHQPGFTRAIKLGASDRCDTCWQSWWPFDIDLGSARTRKGKTLGLYN